MTKEEFYEKWKPNGFYEHNPIEFMNDLDLLTVKQIINAIRATTDNLQLSQTDRHKVISDLNEWERVKRDLK